MRRREGSRNNTKVLVVHREKSKAGKPESDRKIMRATAKVLRGQGGYSVRLVHPEKLSSQMKADLVFSMARTAESHRVLDTIKARGANIINDPRAVAKSMNRKATYAALQKAGVPIPKTSIVSIDALARKGIRGKVILKRPDRHEFTVVVSNPTELAAALQGYREQGVRQVVVQEFVEGEHVKFYGVGSEIFLPPEIEGMVSKTVIGNMKSMARKSGETIGLKVYGGDMILKGEKPFLVDLNDWPSFSSIRETAAAKIAALAKRRG